LDPSAQALLSHNLVTFFGIRTCAADSVLHGLFSALHSVSHCVDVGAPPFNDHDIKEVGDLYNLLVSVLQPDFQADYAKHIIAARAAAGLPAYPIAIDMKRPSERTRANQQD
jgi:hypothetical protein